MTLLTRLCCLLVGLLTFLPIVASAGAPRYQIVDLGSLSGFTRIAPAAINDNEQIVGNMVTRDNRLHGFLWKNKRFTDLGSGDASGINRAGQVLISDMFENFLWDDGVLMPLGELTSEDNQADAVNDNGDVAGVVGAGGPYRRPYLWRNYVGQVLPLHLPSTKPGEYWMTDVSSINNQDEVIGRALPPEIDVRYTYLYQNGKTTLILPSGASMASPVAINNQGWVLGEAKVRNKSIHYTFIWRDGKVTTIGMTSEKSYTSSSTSAVAMNDRGQVIGVMDVETWVPRTPIKETTHPYLWQNGHLYDLTKQIVNSAGWTDWELTAMNNRGDIVGTGKYQGRDRAIMLTPTNGEK